jgi:hypothetical protein
VREQGKTKQLRQGKIALTQGEGGEMAKEDKEVRRERGFDEEE